MRSHNTLPPSLCCEIPARSVVAALSYFMRCCGKMLHTFASSLPPNQERCTAMRWNFSHFIPSNHEKIKTTTWYFELHTHCWCCSGEEDRCSSAKNRSIPSLSAASLVCVFATFLQLFYSPSTDSRLACTFRCLLRCCFFCIVVEIPSRWWYFISLLGKHHRSQLFHLIIFICTAHRLLLRDGRARMEKTMSECGEVVLTGACRDSRVTYDTPPGGFYRHWKSAEWRAWMIRVILNWIKQNEK